MKDQCLINFFVGEIGEGNRRTLRPEFPQGHAEGINVRVHHRTFLNKTKIKISSEMKEKRIYRQAFGGHPTQGKFFAAETYPIVLFVVRHRHGAIGQFDGEISEEEAVPGSDVVVNEVKIRQIFQGVRQLTGEVQIRPKKSPI